MKYQRIKRAGIWNEWYLPTHHNIGFTHKNIKNPKFGKIQHHKLRHQQWFMARHPEVSI